MSENTSEIIANLVVGHKQDGRARYSKEAKHRLVEACLRPGVSISRMALVNGLNANLLRKWIMQQQTQANTPTPSVVRTPADAVALVPVAALNEFVQIESHKAGRGEGSTDARSCIEIVLGDAVVKLQGDIDGRQLQTVLDCLTACAPRVRRSS